MELRNIPQRIKGHRLILGLSQSDLAELCDVSLRTVQNWESGSTVPSLKNQRILVEKVFLKKII